GVRSPSTMFVSTNEKLSSNGRAFRKRNDEISPHELNAKRLSDKIRTNTERKGGPPAKRDRQEDRQEGQPDLRNLFLKNPSENRHTIPEESLRSGRPLSHRFRAQGFLVVVRISKDLMPQIKACRFDNFFCPSEKLAPCLIRPVFENDVDYNPPSS